MNKQEFIDRLRAALNGRVAPGTVIENVNYYEDYINMEIRKGKDESEVLEMLGDPRLIAKTIIATNSNGDNNGYAGEYQNGGYQDSAYQSSAYGDSSYRNSGYQSSGYQENEYGTGNKVSTFRIPGWLGTVIFVLIMILIISVVLSVLSFLAPVIISVLVVMFLVKLFRDWLK